MFLSEKRIVDRRKNENWQMTLSNENAVYACLNYGEAFCPGELEDRSICIDGDIGEVFDMQIF